MVHVAQRYRRSVRAITVFAAAVGLAGSFMLPTFAAAAERQAQGEDSVGDQADGMPSYFDIKSFRVAYNDVSGVLSAQLSLAGDLPTIGGLGFGQVKIGNLRSDGSCEHKVVIGSGLGTLAPLTRWGPESNITQHTATRMLLDPATIAMTASHPALVGGSYDCAFAQTVLGVAVIDSTVPVSLSKSMPSDDRPPYLESLPQTDADTGEQTSEDTRTVTVPTPIPVGPPPTTPTEPIAHISLSSQWPQRLIVGRWLRMTVTIRNIGRAAAKNVRIQIKPPKQVAIVVRSRKLGTLAVGGTRQVRFRVRVGRRVRNGARLTLSASATGLKTVRLSDQIQIRRVSVSN